VYGTPFPRALAIAKITLGVAEFARGSLPRSRGPVSVQVLAAVGPPRVRLRGPPAPSARKSQDLLHLGMFCIVRARLT
jgi:hypothetical protein